jgi:UDP-N-acetylmuramoylalanine--D-glutamate ligase
MGHLLRMAGLKAVVAGNIGIPLAEVAEGAGPGDLLVVEVSSFQLDITPSFHPFAALLLNITPDHLDRYRDYESYIRSKESIFRNQDAGDLAVLNRRDPRCASLAPGLVARVRWFDSSTPLIEGAGFDGEWMAVNDGGTITKVLRRAEFPLRGQHNIENGLAAVSAAWSLGVRERALAEGLKSFPGVEHRMEPAGVVGGVEFVNDSKATNTDSQEKALASFPEQVVLIAGGRDKGLDFTVLRGLVGRTVKGVVLIGEAADKIGAAWDGVTRMERAGTMEEAVETGYRLAQPRGTVLLSPGCASYDMFRNFEERGRAFKQAVRRLAERVGEGVGR